MHEEIINDLKDSLIRVEGALRILEQGNAILTERKLQGLKDKLISTIRKLEKKKETESLSEFINKTIVH